VIASAISATIDFDHGAQMRRVSTEPPDWTGFEYWLL
jgi:hypothetical protein